VMPFDDEITTRPPGLSELILLALFMMFFLYATSVPRSQTCSIIGVFRCMFRSTLRSMVVFSVRHDDLSNRGPGRYDIRVVVSALQSMQNAMFQGESCVPMGMTFESWFLESLL
jgi:hypothetical protein